MSHPAIHQAKPGTDHVFPLPYRQIGRLTLNHCVRGPGSELQKEAWSVPDLAVAQVSQ